MVQLHRDYRKFVERDTEIIAVGPEAAGPFADWWHAHGMPFIGIADPEHTIARSYGQQVKLLKLGRMPADFLIDRNGMIRFKHRGDSMSDIPENRQVLSMIDEINSEYENKGE
jgi:peroxiredoxin Q/BCP